MSSLVDQYQCLNHHARLIHCAVVIACQACCGSIDVTLIRHIAAAQAAQLGLQGEGMCGRILEILVVHLLVGEETLVPACARLSISIGSAGGPVGSTVASDACANHTMAYLLNISNCCNCCCSNERPHRSAALTHLFCCRVRYDSVGVIPVEHHLSPKVRNGPVVQRTLRSGSAWNPNGSIL